jgi:hypothetical protein
MMPTAGRPGSQLSTAHVDYLQQLGLDAQPLPVTSPSARRHRRLFHVAGVGHVGAVDTDQSGLAQWSGPEALLSGMHGERAPVVFQLSGSPRCPCVHRNLVGPRRS